MKGSLSRELDFLAEGANAEKCADDLAHLKFIHVPKVYWSLTSLVSLTPVLVIIVLQMSCFSRNF